MSLAAADFRFVCQFVRERSGIVLDAGKEYLVESRLGPLVRRAGLASSAALVDALRADATGPLGRQVVEAMTTGETRFFRDEHPFALLRDVIVPEAAGRPLAVWSAACSTGQEPYSIAMTLCDARRPCGQEGDLLIATDMSVEAIERARAGRYDATETARGLPPELRDRYFDPDAAGQAWTARPALRARIDFRPLNLTAAWPALPAFDVVFLRNVLIYFDLDTRRRVLGRVHRQLRPGGRLVLGLAESPRGIVEGFERDRDAGGGCFRRT